MRVLREHRVQDRVADLVGELVRVPLGDGFGREEIALAHDRLSLPAGADTVSAGQRSRRQRPSAIRSHEPAGELCLRPPSQRHVLAVGRQDRRLVRVGAEARARPADRGWRPADRDPCARACPSRPPRRRSSRPRSPTRIWPGRRRSPSSARMSGVGSSCSSGTPSSFLSLRSARSFGRKSATAAAITIDVGVGGVRENRVAHLLGGSTAITSTPAAAARQRRVRAPASPWRREPSASRGDRDAHLAARAVPDEPHRVDRLVGRSRGHEDARGPRASRVAAASSSCDARRPRRCPRARHAGRCPRRRGRARPRPGRRIGRRAPRSVATFACGRRGSSTCRRASPARSPAGRANSSSVDGQQIVGQAVRKLGDHIGRGRGDHGERRRSARAGRARPRRAIPTATCTRGDP